MGGALDPAAHEAATLRRRLRGLWVIAKADAASPPLPKAKTTLLRMRLTPPLLRHY